MTATVSNFYYGATTPIAAYLMAVFGAALGLRCTTRSIRRGSRKMGWLALGAVAIGCGIWTMHFVGMIGFSVQGAPVLYDTGRTMLSLVVAIGVVAVGVFLVGYRGSSPATLATAGIITGLGVAAMHYLGMSAMSTNGSVHYNTTIVVLSVLIAIAAATAALWAAVSVHGLWASLGASLVMGVAVSGMHYTGMAAVSVHLTGGSGGSQSSPALLSFLLSMIAGPLVVLLIAAVIVMFDPDMMLGVSQRGSEEEEPRIEQAEFFTPQRQRNDFPSPEQPNEFTSSHGG